MLEDLGLLSISGSFGWAVDVRTKNNYCINHMACHSGMFHDACI